MINRRNLLKAVVPLIATPAIIKPSFAQILQFSGAPSDDTPAAYPFPVSMTDPRFIGMTELNETLNCVASTTYTKLSWIEHDTSAWSALMNNDITCNTWRMKTREGLRFRGNTEVNVNFLMLETYGVDPDHADGFQWEGGDNSVSFTNSHFRTTSGGFTSGFIADNSTGIISFENCLLSCQAGGNNGFVFYADQGFGTVKVSMKDCFIQETGWAGDAIFINRNDGTTFPCEVILWDNVRYCDWDQSTGTLTPGSLVPQPSGT